MIKGIGIDLEKIERFRSMTKGFMKSVYSDKEIEYCKKKSDPAMSFAGKFCAKEAVIKATGKNSMMKDIEILNQKSGEVKVYIRSRHKKNIHCSISHTSEHAIAFVIVENK